MPTPRVQKRVALGFGAAGIGFMGADLLITRNIFTHIAELMVASIVCFIIALVIDHRANRRETQEKL